MSTNAVIDVCIGLILLYLILSLVCTTVNEVIAHAMSLRARTLASGIERLIDDNDLLKAFKQSGLIDTTRSVSKGLPSYVSSRAVAAALLNSISPDNPVPAVAEVLDAVKKLPDSNIRDVLLTSATHAGDNVTKLRDDISAWFDDAMDRLSGVYKRYMQWLSLAIGLLLAIGLNADTISVVNSLWGDATLRAGLVQLADKATADNASLDTLSQTLRRLPAIEANLRPFPVGWPALMGHTDETWQTSLAALAAKIVGLLITGLAISLGAPFWFDLLSKFMNVRATGNKPDKAPAEPQVIPAAAYLTKVAELVPALDVSGRPRQTPDDGQPHVAALAQVNDQVQIRR